VVEFNFDHPDAIDFNELIETVDKLIARESVEVPEYDYENYRRAGT
jgi:uridine kinase